MPLSADRCGQLAALCLPAIEAIKILPIKNEKSSPPSMKTNLSKQQKIAQIFFPAAFIHDSEENYQKLEELIREHHIGGLTFFHSRLSAAANFEKRAEVLEYTETLEKLIGLINRYQAAAESPLLISIDGEYGLAMRVEKTPQYPFAITLGALKNTPEKFLEEVGLRMGLDMKKAGIHLNLAPCADVNTNPDNPVIGYRSFGSDTERVSKLSLAAYKGMKKAGIGACLKHFPGHGDTQTDSHLGLPVVHKTKEELYKEELAPFIHGIRDGVEMIMVGHLAVPVLTEGKEIAASISREIITDLLKHEMGFKGLVISDALNMKAVAKLFPTPGELEWEAFHAGNDILCFSEHVVEGIELIAKNAVAEEIDQAYQKVQDLKIKLGVSKSTSLEVPVFNWEDHSTFQSQLAEEYISVVKGKLDLEEINQLISKGALGHVSFFSKEQSVFEQKMNSVLHQGVNTTNLDTYEKVIVSVFVPSHKPLNRFGMDESQLDQIKNLAQEKSCILILFGNPLALAHFQSKDEFDAIIYAYQAFEETQATVADRLIGRL